LDIRKETLVRTQIGKWGNSAAVRLPKWVVDQLGLAPGTEVDLAVRDGALRLTAVSNVAPTLAELIASMDAIGPQGESELVDWGPDRGSEIIEDDYSASSPASR
jgi:antitoxin MazE